LLVEATEISATKTTLMVGHQAMETLVAAEHTLALELVAAAVEPTPLVQVLLTQPPVAVVLVVQVGLLATDKVVMAVVIPTTQLLPMAHNTQVTVHLLGILETICMVVLDMLTLNTGVHNGALCRTK
jgi:hypothetical protein